LARKVLRYHCPYPAYFVVSDSLRANGSGNSGYNSKLIT